MAFFMKFDIYRMNYQNVCLTCRGQDTYCSNTLKIKTSTEAKRIGCFFTGVVSSTGDDALWGNLQVTLTSVGSFADLHIIDGADDKL